VDPASDEFNLEAITQLHGIATATFIPFAVARLCQNTGDTRATLRVRLRGIVGQVETQQRLRLSWSAESAAAQPLGVQENTIAEWAALGVACAIVWLCGGLRLRAVASPGDCFDFWATDGERHYGVEVSGTMSEELDVRHREKVRQLRENPYGVDGYVIAVSFPARTAMFSFNRFAESDR
jgi:hypothetical protein